MDSPSHSSSEEDADSEDDSDSNNPDPSFTINHSESYEAWSIEGTLVVDSFDSVAHALDPDPDLMDTTPPNRYIRDYSTYPIRVFSIINDLSTEWTGIAVQSMVVLSYRVLTDTHSLIRLSNDFLLTEEEVDYVLDAVLTQRSLQLAPSQALTAPAQHIRTNHDQSLRDLFIDEFRGVGYSYLCKTRAVVHAFLAGSMGSSSDLGRWLVSHQRVRQTGLAELTAWDDSIGYFYWHDFSLGETKWFASPLIREFLRQTLADPSSDLWLGVMEVMPPPSGDVMLASTLSSNSEKVVFVLSWFSVEIYRYAFPGEAVSRPPTRNDIRRVAYEYGRITNIFTLMLLDGSVERRDGLTEWTQIPIGF